MCNINSWLNHIPFGRRVLTNSRLNDAKAFAYAKCYGRVQF